MTSFIGWASLLLATCVFRTGAQPTWNTHPPNGDALASILAQLQRSLKPSDIFWSAVPQDLLAPYPSATTIHEFAQQKTKELFENRSSQVSSFQVQGMLTLLHDTAMSHDTTRCLYYLSTFERLGLWCEGAQGPYSSTVDGWEDPKPEPRVVTRAVGFTLPKDPATAKQALEVFNQVIEDQDQWIHGRNEAISKQADWTNFY
ncbi:hypothetical protein H4R35_001787 [Dimargaris xerosporica]|nr:hypothetical protein H4R35_001787 [Dimargaris xerosporica]